MRRKEKLTLWPNCLPLPVSSHFDAIVVPLLLYQSVPVYSYLPLSSRGKEEYNSANGYTICRNGINRNTNIYDFA